MKKLLVLMGILLFAINPMNAKNLFQIETINNQRNEKVSKAAKKEAKKLKKYGWRVSSLEEQLDRSFQMMYQYDEDLFPKYIIGDARSVGEDYYAAKNEALEWALHDLASNIAKHITALIDNRVANGQLDKGKAVSLKQAVNDSTYINIISKKIQCAVPIIECYRTFSNKSVQVRVVIFYNAKDAMKIVEEEEIKIQIQKRAELDAKAEELVKSVDKLLGIE
jgi:hypothetical protein